MLIFVPVMMVTTLAMTILFLAGQAQEETDMNVAVARNLEMIHAWRTQEIRQDGITDGAFTDLPGAPFSAFFDYYTEVHETEDYIAVATWPQGASGPTRLTEAYDPGVLTTLDSRVGKGSYAGAFVSDAGGVGEHLAGIDLSALDELPDSGTPVLLKIFAKEPS